MTVAEYAASIGKDPFEAYFDLVIANEGRGTATYHCISDEDIYDIIRLPYVMVGSDGIVSSRYEKCHPRGWGTMVRAICAFTKENAIVSLPELIHRITGLPAQRYHLEGKGIIREGYDADLVLMDYDALTDRATYADPTALAEGIDYVMVNGRIVYRDGRLTGETPGKVL
jgi:N-acyl-D-amino-acid deacylase